MKNREFEFFPSDYLLRHPNHIWTQKRRNEMIITQFVLPIMKLKEEKIIEINKRRIIHSWMIFIWIARENRAQTLGLCIYVPFRPLSSTSPYVPSGGSSYFYVTYLQYFNPGLCFLRSKSTEIYPYLSYLLLLFLRETSPRCTLSTAFIMRSVPGNSLGQL